MHSDTATRGSNCTQFILTCLIDVAEFLSTCLDMYLSSFKYTRTDSAGSAVPLRTHNKEKYLHGSGSNIQIVGGGNKSDSINRKLTGIGARCNGVTLAKCKDAAAPLISNQAD